jgi:hypothetical protein
LSVISFSYRFIEATLIRIILNESERRGLSDFGQGSSATRQRRCQVSDGQAPYCALSDRAISTVFI